MSEIKWAVKELEKAVAEKFYGSLQFNYAAGKITNMNKLQSIRPQSLSEKVWDKKERSGIKKNSVI